MLSILIPSYNYDVLPLVKNLQEQATKVGIVFEILVFDDASQNHFNNSRINELESCSFTVLDQNRGRSAIRNLLVSKAKYEWLLFLDADVMPFSENFIAHYVQQIKSSGSFCFSGGIVYEKDKPARNKMLRWKYGHQRETISFEERIKGKVHNTIVNTLFHKSIFEKVRFNETIKSYGYEDVIFITEVLHYYPIQAIDNPVFHLDDNTSTEFLIKTKSALKNLHFLIINNQIDIYKIKIAKVYIGLKKYNLHILMKIFYRLFYKPMEKQLKSSNPSIFLFDIYRLGYLCTLQ